MTSPLAPATLLVATATTEAATALLVAAALSLELVLALALHVLANVLVVAADVAFLATGPEAIDLSADRVAVGLVVPQARLVGLLATLVAAAFALSPLDMSGMDQVNADLDFAPPQLRDAAAEPRDPESLQHSSLWGAKYIAGGAGKGGQFLMPDGSVVSKQEVKTDAVLPAYCEPPNPCPLGYTGDDGCLEEFDNTADFSRQYQGRQDCMCDEEHMFSCPPTHKKVTDLLHEEDAEIEEFSNGLNHLLQKANIQDEHKTLVAKKFHPNKRTEPVEANPYLENGERLLHVVAKKG